MKKSRLLFIFFVFIYGIFSITAARAGVYHTTTADAPAAPGKSGFETQDNKAYKPSPRYLLMQISNPKALCSGSVVPLSGGGTPVAPFYRDGAVMVPLRFAAEYFGLSVGWEPVSQRVTLSGGKRTVVFTVDGGGVIQNTAAAGQELSALKEGDTIYVPVDTLARLLGLYAHTYDENSGDFILLTDQPLGADEDSSSGVVQAHDAADNGAPRHTLEGYKTLGIARLGPSETMFNARTLLLRCGSTHAIVNGCGAAVETTDTGPAAPVRAADGLVYVPLEFCARYAGARTGAAPDGTLSVTYGGETSVFPMDSGYYIKQGKRASDPRFAAIRFDGAVYATAEAVADALGLYYSFDEDTQILIFSAYDTESFDTLRQFAAGAAERLVSEPGITGYLALTFDDGPLGASTARLLDGLKDRGVHATFFVCNYRLAEYPNIIPRYKEEGHELGNHGAAHAVITRLSASEADAEIDATNETILNRLGSAPRFFRPPGGIYSDSVLARLEERSMSCILWSVDPKDWLFRDAEKVASEILAAARDGDIILLHDVYSSSVDAAFEIIDALEAKGYKFLTVSDLALIKGYDLKAGSVYSCFR
jgi:peptidoglycan/xylan/chitin deacetylase (PgdA/CDA1 family)